MSFNMIVNRSFFVAAYYNRREVKRWVPQEPDGKPYLLDRLWMLFTADDKIMIDNIRVGSSGKTRISIAEIEITFQFNE